MKMIIYLTIALFFTPLFAYEVDNISQREKLESLPNGNNALNDKMNEMIYRGVESANRREKCTDETDLTDLPYVYNAIKYKIDSNPVAEIESWADGALELAQLEPPDNHMYAEKSFWSGIVMSVAGLEPSINLNGHVIGVDKLGHFTAQGFEYFSIAYESGRPIDSALSYGTRLEDGKYGLSTTGVKSYGDLGANFSGMKFWANLTMGDNPYLKCHNGKYKIVRAFDWNDYVNDSWDEGINCSEFSESLKEVVDKSLDKMDLQCPVSPDKCKKIAKLNCATRIISPACRAIVGDNINTECADDLVYNKSKAKNCNDSTDNLETLPAYFTDDVAEVILAL